MYRFVLEHSRFLIHQGLCRGRVICSMSHEVPCKDAEPSAIYPSCGDTACVLYKVVYAPEENSAPDHAALLCSQYFQAFRDASHMYFATMLASEVHERLVAAFYAQGAVLSDEAPAQDFFRRLDFVPTQPLDPTIWTGTSPDLPGRTYESSRETHSCQLAVSCHKSLLYMYEVCTYSRPSFCAGYIMPGRIHALEAW